MSQKPIRSPMDIPSQIVLGCLVGLAVILALEARSSLHFSGSGTRISTHGDHTKIHTRRGNSRLDADFEGSVELAADGTGFAKLGKGASVEIRTRWHGDRHRLIVTPTSDGALSYDWRLNGKQSEMDNDAREWLAMVSTKILRISGFQAAERVDHLLTTGEVSSVLREVAEIRSESIQRQYLELLVQRAELTPFELSSALNVVAENVSSDHEASRILEILVSPDSLESPRVADSFLAVATDIGSDAELRKILEKLLSQPGTTATTRDLVVRCVDTMGSDSELAKVLSALVAATPATEDLPSGYDRALESIGSDFEQRRAMDAAFRHPGLGREHLANLLTTATSIGSDFELAELLSELAHRRPLVEQLPAEFFAAAETIAADRELRRVLTAALDRGQLDDRELVALLAGATSIGSDFEAAELLVHLIRKHPVTISKQSKFDVVLDSIESRFENERVRDELAKPRAAPSSNPTPKPPDTIDTIDAEASPDPSERSADPESPEPPSTSA